MNWATILALAGGAFAFKALGLLGPLVGGSEGETRALPPRLEAVASLVPVALLSALIAVQTLSEGGAFELEWRVAGIAAAALAVALRAPFVVVVVLAASVTAVLRALG